MVAAQWNGELGNADYQLAMQGTVYYGQNNRINNLKNAQPFWIKMLSWQSSPHTTSVTMEIMM